MTRRFQLVKTYTFDETGRKQTEKSSFKTLDKAIENAKFWIYKKEKWIVTTVQHIEIIDKVTNKVVWEYTA